MGGLRETDMLLSLAVREGRAGGGAVVEVVIKELRRSEGTWMRVKIDVPVNATETQYPHTVHCLNLLL